MTTPLLVEVIGEVEAGKTHTSLLFPNPVMCDTTPKQESLPILKKLYPGDWEKRWFQIREFEDLRKAIRKAKEDGRKTVVIDTSADLRRLGAKEYLEEVNKERKKMSKSPRTMIHPPTQWKFVNDKVDAIVSEVFNLGMNLVLTAGFKDEYEPSKEDPRIGVPTGKRVRDGYKYAPKGSDLRLYLILSEKVDTSGAVPVKSYKRECRVAKNRFVDRASAEWKEFVEPISYEGIMKMTGLKEEEWVR